MKISKIDTFVLEHALEEKDCFAYSQYRYRSRKVLLCRITTSDGIEGWGESFGPSEIHKTTIDKIYSPLLLDRDPFDSEVIWFDLYNKLRDHGQGGLSIEAISAVDNALWDIKAKSVGLPVYKLMGGGFYDKVMPYATGFYRKENDSEIDLLKEETQRYLDQGFRALKIKIGFGVDYDMKAIRAIRETAGPDVMLMMDSNHAYTASEALEVGRAAEPYHISWYEEPVPPEDLAGYKEIRRELAMPVSGGEGETSIFGFDKLLRERIFDLVQPDCGVIGGLSSYKKISTMAVIHNTLCYPHIWGSAVSLWTGINAAFATPHATMRLYPGPMLLEYDRTVNYFRDQLSGTMPEIIDGWIYPPEQPGLGVDVKMDIIEKFSI
jgi:D-galactarolactone cycloisomerase